MVEVRPFNPATRVDRLDVSTRRRVERFVAAVGGGGLKPDDAVVVARDVDGGLAGVARLRRDDAVSRHFSVAAAQAHIALAPSVVAETDRALDVWNRLFGAVDVDSIELIAARLDAAQIPVVGAAQACGWVVRDTIQSWRISSSRSLAPDGELTFRWSQVRAVGRHELGPRWSATADAFGEAVASKYHLSRFHSDPRLAGRASDFYRGWVERAFRGDWADLVVVAFHEGVPVGFISGRLDEEDGEVRFGSCLHGSTRSGAVSATVAFVACTAAFTTAVFDIHPANATVIGATLAHSPARAAGATHALHWWPHG